MDGDEPGSRGGSRWQGRGTGREVSLVPSHREVSHCRSFWERCLHSSELPTLHLGRSPPKDHREHPSLWSLELSYSKTYIVFRIPVRTTRSLRGASVHRTPSLTCSCRFYIYFVHSSVTTHTPTFTPLLDVRVVSINLYNIR